MSTGSTTGVDGQIGIGGGTGLGIVTTGGAWMMIGEYDLLMGDGDRERRQEQRLRLRGGGLGLRDSGL